MGDPALSHVLEVESLVAGYGTKRVLDHVHLHVDPGEIVAIIGHNGAGKSTALKVVAGLLSAWEGEVRLDGRKLHNQTPRDLRTAGVAYVLQGGRVFPGLTVRENLQMGSATIRRSSDVRNAIDRVLTLARPLGQRLSQRAGELSGGQKQLLSLACALVISPRLLLLDEPSLGLAPPTAKQVLGQLQTLSRESGASVLVVEQRIHEVLRISDRVYVLRRGSVSFSGSPCELLDRTVLSRTYF